MLYRIYTENVNHLETVKRIKSYFPGGFTLITGIGYWEGGEEHSMIIDIMTDNEKHVYDLAWDIMKENKQKSVIVFGITGKVKIIQ